MVFHAHLMLLKLSSRVVRYSDDVAAYGNDREFMWGKGLLIIPVLEQVIHMTLYFLLTFRFRGRGERSVSFVFLILVVKYFTRVILYDRCHCYWTPSWLRGCCFGISLERSRFAVAVVLGMVSSPTLNVLCSKYAWACCQRYWALLKNTNSFSQGRWPAKLAHMWTIICLFLFTILCCRERQALRVISLVTPG